MFIREIRSDEKALYNTVVSHPVQSWEWGEFKKSTGVQILRLGVFDKERLVKAYQLSFHAIPKLNYTVGYFPKGPLPDQEMLQVLTEVGQKRNTIFIKFEPNVLKKEGSDKIKKLFPLFDLRYARSVFTPHTIHIDLSKNREKLLSAMKSKTRYNVRLAKRKGVTVSEDKSTLAFETYLRLTRETASRQGFYVHDEDYHREMWEILHASGMAHLLVARYKKQILTTWIVFIFHRVLYYPYGASANQHRNLMANNLMMWEAMLFGKRKSCKLFDLWGSLGPNPDPKDHWYGFHRFKEGYGGKLISYVGTFDLVLIPQFYMLFRVADKARWQWLRFRSRFR